jgi:hypothetical protein
MFSSTGEMALSFRLSGEQKAQRISETWKMPNF